MEVTSSEAGRAKVAEVCNLTACYFCNDDFEMGQLQAHLKQCGSILEQCAVRCGAWVQRRHRTQHAEQCPQRDVKPPPPHTWSVNSVPITDCVTVLEKDVEQMRQIMLEDSRDRHTLGAELDNIKSRLTQVEERGQHLMSTLAALRNNLDDEGQRAANWSVELRNNIHDIQMHFQELQNAQVNTQVQLDNAASTLVQERNERELMEQVLNQQDVKIKQINTVECNIEYLKNLLLEEQQIRDQTKQSIQDELNQIRHSLNQEQIMTGHVLSEQINNLTLLRQDIEENSSSPIPADKYQLLDVQVKALKGTVDDDSVKVEVLKKDLKALSKSYMKLRQEFNDFRNSVTFGNLGKGNVDNTGHLIWRIDNYTSKMSNARDNDTTLYSPVFRTNKYGYTLQVEINLNGVGRWRGQHLTATVRLVPGEYDALLDWPCDLHIDIIIKDQAADKNQARDIVKSLNVKKKSAISKLTYEAPSQKCDDQRSLDGLSTTCSEVKSLALIKKQHVFIPHATLDKLDYVKNNAIFVEISVNT